MEMCEQCSARFTLRCHLYRHLKKAHGYKLPKPMSKCECSTCGRTFATNFNLNRHIKSTHTNSEHTSTSAECSGVPHDAHTFVTNNENDEKSENDKGINSKIKVKCEACDRLFVDRSTMRRHMKRLHNKRPTNQAAHTLQCPYCDLWFSVHQDVEDHLIAVHDFIMEVETLKFDSIEAFQSWKTDNERTTQSSFIKRSTKGNTSYYICHRSGKSRSEATERKQRKISIKTGKCCPARITTIYDEKSSSVMVVFYRSHAGHIPSIKYLHLSKDERSMLAEKLRNGVPFDRIIDDIRTSVTDQGQMTRLHMLDKQDLRNIVREFGLDRDRAHDNDAFSVDSWVDQQKQFGDDCPFIYYKRQDHTDDNSCLSKDQVFHKRDVEMVENLKNENESLGRDEEEVFTKHQDIVVKTMVTQPDVHVGEGVNPLFKLQTIMKVASGVAGTLSNDAAQSMVIQAELFLQKLKDASKKFPNDRANSDVFPQFPETSTNTPPSHKNIQPQRFHSTKKKSKKVQRLLEPTNLQKQNLKMVMRANSEQQIENVHDDFDHKY